MGKAKAVKLTNVVSAYIELPVGVHTIGDKKYTVEEVEADWLNEDGSKAMQKSIVLIEPATTEAPTVE